VSTEDARFADRRRRLPRHLWGVGHSLRDRYVPEVPEPLSDEEREAALDAKWAALDALDVVRRYTADLTVGYEARLDDQGVRSEERENVMRGDE
jgi:hypothetical protein